jgi:LPXTG-site transpeptidase (sortase) family protein
VKRAINVFGSLLMLAGIGLLAYVGISYARQQSQSSPPHWNASQRAKGKELAQRLTKSQKVSIPRRLGNKVALPPAGTESAVRIVIPKIGVDAPVVETPPVNGTWIVADWAVGHLTTSPEPGAIGNMALSAHDDIKGEIFKRLGELRPGDAIKIYTRHALYTYTVVNQQAVDPSNVSVLAPTRTPTATLITCTPYWVDTQRLIVQALLKSRRAV